MQEHSVLEPRSPRQTLAPVPRLEAFWAAAVKAARNENRRGVVIAERNGGERLYINCWAGRESGYDRSGDVRLGAGVVSYAVLAGASLASLAALGMRSAEGPREQAGSSPQAFNLKQAAPSILVLVGSRNRANSARAWRLGWTDCAASDATNHQRAAAPLWPPVRRVRARLWRRSFLRDGTAWLRGAALARRAGA